MDKATAEDGSFSKGLQPHAPTQNLWKESYFTALRQELF